MTKGRKIPYGQWSVQQIYIFLPQTDSLCVSTGFTGLKYAKPIFAVTFLLSFIVQLSSALDMLCMRWRQ